MNELTEAGHAIKVARDEIVSRLTQVRKENMVPPTLGELIEALAQGRDRDPFRAAMTSLLDSGAVTASPSWKLELHSGV